MPKKNNLAWEIYDTLKNQILCNALRPGQMISEAYIEQQFHVSRTPARQALQMLEEKGLVEIHDGVGTFVTTISYEDMKNAYEIRCAAEKLAAQTSIYNIPEAELDELEKRFVKYKNQLESGGYGASYDEMMQADWRLHDLIIGSSDNRFIAETVEKITFILRRYQYSYVSAFSRAVNEHLEMIACIKAGDLEGLLRILDMHLQFRPME